MPLRGSVVLRRPIPEEPGEWIELRLLGWRALEVARQTRQINALKSFSGQADALAIATSLQRSQTADQPAPAPPADPLNDYDLMTLLMEGVVNWSYDDPVTPDNLERLDERTAKWIAQELIEPVHEQEGKGSNGLLHSIPTSTETV